MRRSTSSLALVLTLAGAWVSGARAECFPTCRAGYVCKADTCVVDAPSTPGDASCFPACRDGFACRAGACVRVGNATGPGPTSPGAGAPLVPPPAIDPTGPPPEPIDAAGAERWRAELARRDANRHDVKFGLVVSAGYSWNLVLAASPGLRPDPQRYPMVLTGDGPIVTLGFGLRKNVVEAFGVNASVRAEAYFFEGETASVEVTGSFHRYTDVGTGIRLVGDFGVHVGPFAAAFPMVISLGGAIAMDTAMGTIHFDDAFTHTGDLSYTETHLRGGPVIALGFVFGGDEQFDLNLRVELFTSDTNDSGRGDAPEVMDSTSVALEFRWSWL